MENNDVQHLQKLRTYWDEHQAFPSMAKLREVVAMGSTASVFEMVGRLVEAGLLQRVEGRIAPTKAFLARPVECARSSQPGQFPDPESPAALNLLDYVMPEPGSTFFVPVPDEQLAAKGLRPGDLLVMQAGAPVKTGDIVATRQGGMHLLSLLTSITGKKLVLEPAIQDAHFDPGLTPVLTRADIAGVAVAMVRRFDRELPAKVAG